MKRFFLSLISFLLSLVTTAQSKPSDQSLLWRISGKGLAKSSYLFGTIHMICPSDFVWTDKMKESFKKSEKVCFEMDLDDPTVMMQASMGLIDQTGKKLRDYFTPEQYKLLEHYMKDSLGMEIQMFEQMKPVALLSMVGTSAVSCQSPISYEDSLMKIATDQRKEVMGLEAATEQLQVLETIPTDTVIAQIMDAIQNNSQDDSEFNQLTDAYRRQDLPALYHLLTSTKDLGNAMDVFLDDRNKKWIPRMSDKMKDTSVFFAVGAGHLYGHTGVISLLRNAGYQVEPVK